MEIKIRTDKSYFLTLRAILVELVSVITLHIQIGCVYFVLKKDLMRKDPIYILLISFCISAILRILFIFTSIFIVNCIPEFTIWLQIYLYVDAIVFFFSISIVFFMSLSRCLFIVKKQLNEKMFRRFRVAFPIVISILVSLVGSVSSIEFSGIERKFDEKLGFENIGKTLVPIVLVNRIFFIFPVGSILCYLVIYFHSIKKVSHDQETSNNGEPKRFIQLAIVSIFYQILLTIYDIGSEITWSTSSSKTSTWNCYVYHWIPAIILPICVIYENQETWWIFNAPRIEDISPTLSTTTYPS